MSHEQKEGRGFTLDDIVECEGCACYYKRGYEDEHGESCKPSRLAMDRSELRRERDALRAEKDDALRLVTYWHRKHDDRRENEDAMVERVIVLEAAMRRILDENTKAGRWMMGCSCGERLPAVYEIARAALVKP